MIIRSPNRQPRSCDSSTGPNRSGERPVSRSSTQIYSIKVRLALNVTDVYQQDPTKHPPPRSRRKCWSWEGYLAYCHEAQCIRVHTSAYVRRYSGPTQLITPYAWSLETGPSRRHCCCDLTAFSAPVTDHAPGIRFMQVRGMVSSTCGLFPSPLQLN